MNVDVTTPDAPRREITGEHRLQHLPGFTADVALLMAATGQPLNDFQQHCLLCALDALLFGEQAA